MPSSRSRSTARCGSRSCWGQQWRHVDLDKATVTVAQQLAQGVYTVAAFTPTKTDNVRTITIGAQAVSGLKP
jgi:hypothetical protein